MRPFAMFTLSLLAAPRAEAYIFTGHPVVTTKTVRVQNDITSASATLDRVEVHLCTSGQVDYEVDEVVDLDAGWSIEIDGGDLCGVTLVWASDVEVAMTWHSIAYEQPSTMFTLTGNPSTVSVGLTPFEITGGSSTGTAPSLELTIE